MMSSDSIRGTPAQYIPINQFNSVWISSLLWIIAQINIRKSRRPKSVYEHHESRSFRRRGLTLGLADFGPVLGQSEVRSKRPGRKECEQAVDGPYSAHDCNLFLTGKISGRL